MNVPRKPRPVVTNEQINRVAHTAAMLAVDQVQQANSGHPGAPMGMRYLWAVLWLRFLNYHPDDPKWCRRDRVVLSNGHAVALWYSFLHLMGWLNMNDLKTFRQLGSRTPGHPEFGVTRGIEATTGPLGQGVANAGGMAIGATKFAASAGTGVFDQKMYVFLGDGCVQEGVGNEAFSLAGRLGFKNLIAIYDSNRITIDGSTDLSMVDDVEASFLARGWAIMTIDGNSIDEITRAFEWANRSLQPALIIAETQIGHGSPKKQNTAGAHGEPLGASEVEAVKKLLGWPLDPFHVPVDVPPLFAALHDHLRGEAEHWEQNVWKPIADTAGKEVRLQLDGFVPDDLLPRLVTACAPPAKPIASRKMGEAAIAELYKSLPGFIVSSADLTPSNLTRPGNRVDFNAVSPHGDYLRGGVREHALGAFANGLAYFGGFIPCVATFLSFYDYMREPVRLAALARLRVIFLFTHDSIFLGEDGPTHQPYEHLLGLRSVRGLDVQRPSNGLETAVAFYKAATSKDGPTAIVLSRQAIETWTPPEGTTPETVMRGGYLAYGSSDRAPQLVLVGTGSEVPLAFSVAKKLEADNPRLRVRVVSMPSTPLYRRQDATYRDWLIPEGVPTVTIEAASTLGWPQHLGNGMRRVLTIGVDTFGESGPAAALVEHFGFTTEKIIQGIYTAFVDLAHM